MNKLFFSDCLKVLKDLHGEYPKGFIDLVYIDPPFNSKRDYNILFESIDMKDTKAQREAFSDTWSNVSYIDSLREIQYLDLDLYNYLTTLDNIRVSKSTVSYLATMAIRIYYIHKVLKDTGSFYLHCDPTMSHLLKFICDIIFGEKNFKNEIIWRRQTSSGYKGLKHFGNSHDVIFYYTKSDTFTFNAEYNDYSDEYLRKQYNKTDETGRVYRTHWIGTKTTQKTIDKFIESGRIVQRENGTYEKRLYLDEMKGVMVDDIWTDVKALTHSGAERLGYPTQKPEKLLERIIAASSNKKDIVADFFCGCGTTIAAAQSLKRNWIGVDISHLAIRLILDRLTRPYPERRAKIIRDNIQVTGFPRDIDGAKMLARETDNGRFGFQDWIMEVMLGGVSNPKKTGDGGFDGYLPFYLTQDKKGVILIEVKSGKVGVKNMREFIQVIDKRKAELGVFVCFEDQAGNDMRREAKQAGCFESESYPGRYDKIQILTVEDLLDGRGIDLPYRKEAFKTATKNLDYIPDDEKLQFE